MDQHHNPIDNMHISSQNSGSKKMNRIKTNWNSSTNWSNDSKVISGSKTAPPLVHTLQGKPITQQTNGKHSGSIASSMASSVGQNGSMNQSTQPVPYQSSKPVFPHPPGK